MADPLPITNLVVVPADAIETRAVRSGGPGGQNVNKVASKVELRIDLDRIVGLDPPTRARLRRLAAPQLDADGKLLITSQKTRDQPRNLEDAREKVKALIERALIRPVHRRPTKPSRGAVERRLSDKKKRSRSKQDRRGDES